MKSQFVVSLFLLFLFSSSLFPQDVSNDLIRNSSSLNFYIINGYAVSYKFKSESNIKFRLHLDLSTSFSDGNREYKRQDSYPENINRSEEDVHNKGNRFNIAFAPQLYLSVYKTTYAELYVGTGPFVNYDYYKTTSGRTTEYQTTPNKESSESINTSNTYSLGVLGFAGLEGYVTKNISLFCEIYLNGGKSWNDHKYFYNSSSNFTTYNTTDESNENSWYVSLSNIRIGVSVYF